MIDNIHVFKNNILSKEFNEINTCITCTSVHYALWNNYKNILTFSNRLYTRNVYIRLFKKLFKNE